MVARKVSKMLHAFFSSVLGAVYHEILWVTHNGTNPASAFIELPDLKDWQMEQK
jgi:hypothetical protein